MNKTSDAYEMYITYGKFRSEPQGASQIEFRLILEHEPGLKEGYFYQTWLQLQNPQSTSEFYESYACTVHNTEESQQALREEDVTL